VREAPTIFVAVLCSVSQPARAETRILSDERTEALCESVQAELEQIGVAASAPETGNLRRARRRAFARTSVNALAVCRAGPDRVEVFYPDGSRLGEAAFATPASDDAASVAVYVSERIRSERFIADVAVPVPFAPAVWWLGIGADVLFSPGNIAPLAFITLDAGYRFHRHWSLAGFVSVQPYMRRLNAGSLEASVRLDQLGVAISYHPLVTKRADLALGARVSASRFGADGQADGSSGALQGGRDAAWLAFPAGRVSLRISLAKQLSLRVQGELGALLPRALISTGADELGSLGVFAAQTGLGLEVHFR
jgi:hypothetical protein